ncbi:MAG TPA: hypothetical protein VE244_06850 [Nitrososphaeraceae archaeon]|nr:hypothetical protein [Nitrososphaeraceae archaeon]
MRFEASVRILLSRLYGSILDKVQNNLVNKPGETIFPVIMLPTMILLGKAFHHENNN